MNPWQPGRAEIDDLIARGHLRRLQGASHGVKGLMDRARQQLASAHKLLNTDPGTAYVVAYDAAKHAGMALLAEQDLRATAAGGHLAIEGVLIAQFKGVFSKYRLLRRRRNELDYPTGPDDFAATAEAEKALEAVAEIVDSAQKILTTGALPLY